MKWVTTITFCTSVYQTFSCWNTENLYRKETGGRREEKWQIKTYTKESTAQKFQWYLSKQCERYWSANTAFLVPGGPVRLNLPKPRSISMDIKPWTNLAYRRRKGSWKRNILQLLSSWKEHIPWQWRSLLPVTKAAITETNQMELHFTLLKPLSF